MSALSRLLELVYEAPISGTFTPFLDAVVAETGARGAAFKWTARDTGQVHFDSAGLEPDLLERYATHFAAIDPWGHVHVDHGANIFGDEMLERKKVEASLFYNEYGRTTGYVDLHKLVFEPTRDHAKVSLGILKSERIPERRHHRERLLTNQLMPHIARALTMFGWARDLEDERRSLSNALDTLSAGVIFLDARRHVRLANRAASRILARNDGLRTEGGVLRALTNAGDRALAALFTDDGATTAMLPRSSGEAFYRASVLPLPKAHEETLRRGITTLVFLHDPDTLPATNRSEEVLAQVYGLTAAEARVAVLIASGQSPREVAEALGTSWHTVRTQLRVAFGKTGVNRQSALARLVNGIAISG